MKELLWTNYKKSSVIAVLIFISIICTLLLIRTSERIQRLSPLPGAFVEAMWNRSATILNAFQLYESSGNVSAVKDMLLEPPEDRKVNKSGRYVSVCPGVFDGRRLGNQMFNFVAMLHVARLTGRRVAMARRPKNDWLDRWFQVPITRVDSVEEELCPCAGVGEARHLAYSPQMSTLHNRSDIAGKSLLVCGFFQSWKYTVGVESAIRHHLRPHPHVSTAVNSYMDEIRPAHWKGLSYSRVGIHVRAGDIAIPQKFKFGYTIPQRSYFAQAMDRFTSELGGRVQFIVTTDSLRWARTAINFSSIAQQLNRTSGEVNVTVVYSEGHDAGFDLVLLSLCDGVIMSTGSFGWWGAWLANKTTIYYSNWPRTGSPLTWLTKKEDYYPPSWIPIDGPAFPCCPSVG